MVTLENLSSLYFIYLFVLSLPEILSARLLIFYWMSDIMNFILLVARFCLFLYLMLVLFLWTVKLLGIIWLILRLAFKFC